MEGLLPREREKKSVFYYTLVFLCYLVVIFFHYVIVTADDFPFLSFSLLFFTA